MNRINPIVLIRDFFFMRGRVIGMAFFPFVFIKKSFFSHLSPIEAKKLLNHEKIHIRQQVEMLLIFFYAWYLTEWCIRALTIGRPYYAISFEKEAYENQEDDSYLEKRKPFSFLKYL